MNRELATIEAMIVLYCGAHHQPRARLCPGCRELLEYAEKRLGRCLFQDDKPTCGKCPVHCYAPAMRQKVVEVMRYSGPRMLLHHPLMALRHLLDGQREIPPGPHRKSETGAVGNDIDDTRRKEK